MSKVISFRLDEDNPREERALNILFARRKQGYSTRHIITDALLILDDIDNNHTGMLGMGELKKTLNEVTDLLARIDGESDPLQEKDSDQPMKNELSETFIASVKNAIKPGIKLD